VELGDHLEGPHPLRISQLLENNTFTRSGIERRKNPRINFRSLLGLGNRRTIRRKEDQSIIFLVDLFSTKLFIPIIVTLFFSVMDALLTLFLISHGAYEANPIMAYFLNQGPYIFFSVKYLLTSLGLIILLFFRNLIFRTIKIKASALLNLIAGIFIAVVAWELYLVFKIIC
jgi:hypothetical protein